MTAPSPLTASARCLAAEDSPVGGGEWLQLASAFCGQFVQVRNTVSLLGRTLRPLDDDSPHPPVSCLFPPKTWSLVLSNCLHSHSCCFFPVVISGGSSASCTSCNMGTRSRGLTGDSLGSGSGFWQGAQWLALCTFCFILWVWASL